MAPLPTHCEICNRTLSNSGVLYDARIPNSCWAILCSGCFKDFDCKLGVGRAQKYVLDKPDGKVWTRVSVH